MRRVIGWMAVAASLAVALTACGSSSTSSSTTTTPAPAPSGSGGAGATVSTGPVRAVLRAENHAPRINRPWAYSVHATDAAGRPLTGRVDIDFVFGGQVVGRDTPPTHPLTQGRWHDVLRFPPQALGQPLTFRVVVHTSPGSVTLNWPVTVIK